MRRWNPLDLRHTNCLQDDLEEKKHSSAIILFFDLEQAEKEGKVLLLSSDTDIEEVVTYASR